MLDTSAPFLLGALSASWQWGDTRTGMETRIDTVYDEKNQFTFVFGLFVFFPNILT